MPYVDTLPSKAEIFSHWHEKLYDVGAWIDWGEPSCWDCGFHYGSKYDIKSADASWEQILAGWDRMPLQRCHIVPRSLGGTDEPSNLFLMCRECHDLAPNTAVPDIFFQWIRTQSYERRESAKIDEALRSFGLGSNSLAELAAIMKSPDFNNWTAGKLGLHRPQSNYPAVSNRLTPATMIGLAKYYIDHKMADIMRHPDT